MKDIYHYINYPTDSIRGVSVVNDDYISYQDESWCFIIKSQANALDPTGWKFHIAIDERDLKQAFNLIADIALKNDCQAFKVLKDDNTLSERQAGKTIVLYDFGSENWHKILPQIEGALANAQIRPNSALNNPNNNLNKDKRVEGSQYIMYGNDQNANGKYILAALRSSYNETGKLDPFLNLSVKPNTLTGHLAALASSTLSNKASIDWQNPANWQQAETKRGERIARLPVNGLTDEEITALQSELAWARIQTSVRDSAQLGKTLRVTGSEEILKLSKLFTKNKSVPPMFCLAENKGR